MKTQEEIIKQFLDENGEVFVQLTNDFLFKEIFGREENKKYLADFLECIFGYERGSLLEKLECEYESSIEKMQYLQKASRCDLIAKFDGKIVNLEMYSTYNRESVEKSTFYVMAIKASLISRGMSYTSASDILQFNFIKEDKYGIKNHYQAINNVEVFYIVIDKMLNTIYDKDNRFGKYLRLFIAESYQEREQIAKGDKILMEFVKTIRDYCNNEEFAKYFTDEYWNKRIYRLDGLQEGKDIGLREGKILGIEEGKILGIEEGKTLGIEEGKILGMQEERTGIVKEMLKNNYSLDDIVKISKLSLKEIEEIKQNLEK